VPYLVVATVAAFNLVCTGTHAQQFAGTPMGEPKARSTTYRVHAAAKRFCTDDCKEFAPIASVTDEKIIFTDLKLERPMARLHFAYKRDTRRMNITSTVGAMRHEMQMTCTEAPFSGIPDEATPVGGTISPKVGD
jgi:hypothetical protein